MKTKHNDYIRPSAPAEKVITFSTSSGAWIDLTEAEIAAHTAAGTWPKDWRGEEYAQVSQGLHWGVPTSPKAEPQAQAKAAHTPGPWRVGDAGCTVFGPPNGNPAPQQIANMCVKNFAANARLIAAAPDSNAANIDCQAAIAEALAEAHRLNDSARETVFNPAVFQLLGAALVKARAAIAKVEGHA